MKHSKILVVTSIFLSIAAFAATKKKIENPFKTLEFTLKGMAANDYSGEDCHVSAKKLDATTWKVTYQKDGSDKKVDFYAHDGKLKGVRKSDGDDYEETYTDPNGDSIVLTVADDAYNIITLNIGSKSYSCEQDM